MSLCVSQFTYLAKRSLHISVSPTLLLDCPEKPLLVVFVGEPNDFFTCRLLLGLLRLVVNLSIFSNLVVQYVDHHGIGLTISPSDSCSSPLFFDDMRSFCITFLYLLFCLSVSYCSLTHYSLINIIA